MTERQRNCFLTKIINYAQYQERNRCSKWFTNSVSSSVEKKDKGKDVVFAGKELLSNENEMFVYYCLLAQVNDVSNDF